MPQINSEPAVGIANYQWSISLHEKFGHLWIDWKTDALFSLVNANIEVFKASLPPGAVGPEKFLYTEESSGSWDTGLQWGSGYYGALVASTPHSGFTYVVTAGPTEHK
jgi:hypothetical protein